MTLDDFTPPVVPGVMRSAWDTKPPVPLTPPPPGRPWEPAVSEELLGHWDRHVCVAERRATGQTESGGIVLAVTCWAPSAQRTIMQQFM